MLASTPNTGPTPAAGCLPTHNVCVHAWESCRAVGVRVVHHGRCGQQRAHCRNGLQKASHANFFPTPTPSGTHHPSRGRPRPCTAEVSLTFHKAGQGSAPSCCCCPPWCCMRSLPGARAPGAWQGALALHPGCHCPRPRSRQAAAAAAEGGSQHTQHTRHPIPPSNKQEVQELKHRVWGTACAQGWGTPESGARQEGEVH